jgi:hypothetical protein
MIVLFLLLLACLIIANWIVRVTIVLRYLYLGPCAAFPPRATTGMIDGLEFNILS